MQIKYFISVLLLLSFVVSGMAQGEAIEEPVAKAPKNSQDFKTFRIGVVGESSISWMKPTMDVEHPIQYESDGSRLVAGWGLVFDYNFTENYTLSTGFRFGGQGGKFVYEYDKDSSNSEFDVERTYKMKYLEIPLDLKLKTNQIGYFTYFFQIGLRPGFRMEAIAEDEYRGGNLDDKSVDLVEADESQLFHLGFNVGLGAEYQISKSFSAFAGLSYRSGMTDMLNGKNRIDPNLHESARLRGITLSAGFIF